MQVKVPILTAMEQSKVRPHVRGSMGAHPKIVLVFTLGGELGLYSTGRVTHIGPLTHSHSTPGGL